jgi:FkbM family methyltransferase
MSRSAVSRVTNRDRIGWAANEQQRRTRTAKAFFFFAVLGVFASVAFAMGVDAGAHFISARFWVRSSLLLNRITGIRLDDAWLKPVMVEVEPGVHMLLDPSDLVSHNILLTGGWQGEVWNAIASNLTEGSVFLDVGAHIGYDTLRGSKQVGPTGKVIAFEPNPKTLELLRGNLEASKAGNVIVQPIACADKEGVLTLYDSAGHGNSGASSLSQETAAEWHAESLPSYTVRGRPIDDVVEEIGLARLDVIKMDIEGAETIAIRGARRTLLRFRPVVITEVSAHLLENLGSSVAELTALMAELGYAQHRVIDEVDWEWIPSVTR